MVTRPADARSETPAESLPNGLGAIAARVASGMVSGRRVWSMLGLRCGLILIAQLLFASAFLLSGNDTPWRSSADWWLVSLALAEFVNLWVLKWAAGRERIRLRDLYNFDASRRSGDLKWLGIGLLGAAPLVLLPSLVLAGALFGDPAAAQDLIFRPIPTWAAWSVLLVFPIIHGLTELPTYFGYVMPRLQALTGRPTMPLLVSASVLSVQHMFLPLLFDWNYVAWRSLMFLPLAIWFGWVIRSRPTSLPYLAAAHAVLDISLPIYVLIATLGG